MCGALRTGFCGGGEIGARLRCSTGGCAKGSICLSGNCGLGARCLRCSLCSFGEAAEYRLIRLFLR